MTFFTKEEVINMFNEFIILEIQEIERDRPTSEGKKKHWHTFDVIARKTNNKD